MTKSKKTNSLNSLIQSITNKAILESIDLYLKENTSDEKSERARMENALKSRYVNEDDDEDSSEKKEDVIDKEKIVPGLTADAEDDEDQDNENKKKSTEVNVPIPTNDQLLSPSYEVIRDQLNLVRSGSSFKNQKIDDQFRKYIDSLGEKKSQQLLLFITGIAQILAEKMPASEVVRPDLIEPKKSNSKEQNTNDIGVSNAQQGSTVNTSPDDIGPVPIIVGEHVAVRKLLEKQMIIRKQLKSVNNAKNKK
jgi:hypothetical protein